MDLSNLDIRRIVDLERLDLLLTDMSRLLGLNFVLFDVNGSMVKQVPTGRIRCRNVTEDGSLLEGCEHEHQNLFDQVKERGEAVHSACCHGSSMIGVNIGIPPTLFGVLNACHVSATGSPQQQFIPVGEGEAGSDPEEGLIRFLVNMADLVANECYQNVELENLSEELETRYEELHMIYEIGREIKVTDSLESTIQFFADKSMDVLVPACITFFSNLYEECFIFENQETGLISADEDPEISDLSRHVTQEACSKKEPVVFNLNDLLKIPDIPQSIMTRFGSVLSVPLVTKDKTYGAINILKKKEEGSFFSGEVKLMNSLGKEAAIVIKNSELFQNLRSLFINMLKTLVFTIEAKDQYTRGHSERVNHYSTALGRLLSYSAREMEVLNSASLLHDIGKLKVPGMVLRKPGPLNDREWALIKEHPVTGVQILSPIQEFQVPLQGVRHHHERWDGGGYPDGLQGEEIPEIARIIAIADTYDALTSKRAYRGSLDHSAAIEEIERCLGTQFDPRIGALFIKHFTDSPEGDMEAQQAAAT